MEALIGRLLSQYTNTAITHSQLTMSYFYSVYADCIGVSYSENNYCVSVLSLSCSWSHDVCKFAGNGWRVSRDCNTALM